MEEKMNLNVFKLEEYLAHHEFKAPYLLCCSDAESHSLKEILAMADEENKKLWDDLRLGYTEIKGLPKLREEIIASFYKNLSLEQILCFAGAEEGIFCTLHTLCQDDDHVIVLTPAYQSLLEIPRLKNTKVTMVKLREENNWRLDLDDIKKAIKPTTKCIIINFPHNPTGQVINKSELDDLVLLCDRNGLWLFFDEVYRLLGIPKEPWAPPAATIYPKALSLGVLSKAFGMAGLRIGWIACQDKALLKKIEQTKYYTSICNSAPSEILGLITLKNRDKILARNNQIVDKNLRILDNFMADYKDRFSWVRPEGGCVGFVQYNSKESVEDFSLRLLREKGVLIMPASIFDHQSNHFRIGFGRKNMPAALEKMKEFL